jgi:hypothetical protein
MKKAQKRTLKPLYISIRKKEKEQKEDLDREKSLNSSLTKKNSSKASKNPKGKSIVMFPTQNYHNLNKSHLNSVLNKSDSKDEKQNNISKLENSIVENYLIIKNDIISKTNEINNGKADEIINSSVIVQEYNENLNNEDNAEKQENEGDKVENAEQAGEGNYEINNKDGNEIVEQAVEENKEIIEEIAS